MYQHTTRTHATSCCAGLFKPLVAYLGSIKAAAVPVVTFARQCITSPLSEVGSEKPSFKPQPTYSAIIEPSSPQGAQNPPTDQQWEDNSTCFGQHNTMDVQTERWVLRQRTRPLDLCGRAVVPLPDDARLASLVPARLLATRQVCLVCSLRSTSHTERGSRRCMKLVLNAML